MAKPTPTTTWSLPDKPLASRDGAREVAREGIHARVGEDTRGNSLANRSQAGLNHADSFVNQAPFRPETFALNVTNVIDSPPALRNRSAFTLLELLLTLSVLAAIASVAIPQVGAILGDRRLVRAADQLRIEMTGLRVKAMRGGRVMMLQCMLEDGQFRMRPFYSLADSTEALDQTGSQSTLLSGAEQATVAIAAPPEDAGEEIVELPDDVLIRSVAVVSAARASEIEQQVLGEQGDGWSQPILFYTDGTTSTAAVTITHATHGNIVVKLRGITGDVTVGEVTGVAP